MSHIRLAPDIDLYEHDRDYSRSNPPWWDVRRLDTLVFFALGTIALVAIAATLWAVTPGRHVTYKTTQANHVPGMAPPPADPATDEMFLTPTIARVAVRYPGFLNHRYVVRADFAMTSNGSALFTLNSDPWVLVGFETTDVEYKLKQPVLFSGMLKWAEHSKTGRPILAFDDVQFLDTPTEKK